MTVAVFVGPSVSLDDARGVLGDAEYLPPVSAGDVSRLVERAARPRAIAVIDGFFGHVPSVWHKEILFALARGVRVFGAASMGALRAAELRAFGMEGIGRIYEQYASGELEDDDEVAVAHASAAERYRSSSEAMVNLRDGLARARDAGVITKDTRDALVALAKARFYPDRSWAALERDGREAGVDAGELSRLREFVARERPNLKRDDALHLLGHVARLVAHGLEPARPDFEFHPTSFWTELQQRTSGCAGAEPRALSDVAGVSLDELHDHLRVESGGRSEVLRGALLLLLLVLESERSDVSVSTEAMNQARALLRSRCADDADLERLVSFELTCEAVTARHGHSLALYVRDELARRGTLDEVAGRIAKKRLFLRSRGFDNPQLAHAGLSIDELLAWYRRRTGVDEPSAEAYAERLGMASPRVFLTELLGQYLFERHGG